jgi:uncharacterized protein YceH (UPF0502 family)
MAFELSAIEARVLGCLLEKERTTPEYYPLTLNGLMAACNQTTNREPITSYDESTVEQGLDALRQKKLVLVVHSAGARVPKYRHNLFDHYVLRPPESSILCVLLLRGAQTAGELRSRTERLSGPLTLAEIDAYLEELARGGDPLVRVLPARPGQKERRFIQLLAGEPEVTEAPVSSALPIGRVPEKSRLDALEGEVNSLKRDLQALREDLANFKKEFGVADETGNRP